MDAESMKKTLREFVEEVFNKKNVDYARENMLADFVEHQAMPGLPPTKEGTIKGFEEKFAAMPDFRGEVLDVIASGDRVAGRTRFSGTQNAEFMGIPATGKSFSIESIDIVRFNDEGQIAEHWGVMDTMGMMGQLGLLPPPSEA